MNQKDLTQVEAHFAFGRNWAEYAAKITEAEVREAEAGLLRLLGGERLDGKRFLDIGSGSGVHSLAALRLGAREVLVVDIDADSVATTRAVLSRFAPGGAYRIEQESVFNLDPTKMGTFDVVYAWGVLHHTGDLDHALACAARMVAPEGLLMLALYRRIWMDPFWRWEKRWYAQASPAAQARARWMYVTLFRLGLRLTGRRFADYVAAYRGNRGMNYYHDVHDWLGGWPYESISPDEVATRMTGLKFMPVRIFARKGRFWGRGSGIFGSGCDEYVYKKVEQS
jgi:2-polyprenyl-6-hydroxyphenyl methylase/3-demethylubiquinone-9 3-methyltransferase